jgi:hypothetical protein
MMKCFSKASAHHEPIYFRDRLVGRDKDYRCGFYQLFKTVIQHNIYNPLFEDPEESHYSAFSSIPETVKDKVNCPCALTEHHAMEA